MCVGIREESGPAAALECVGGVGLKEAQLWHVECSTVLLIGERGTWRGDGCFRLFISYGIAAFISWICFLNTSAGVCSPPLELRGGRRLRSARQEAGIGLVFGRRLHKVGQCPCVPAELIPGGFRAQLMS